LAYKKDIIYEVYGKYCMVSQSTRIENISITYASEVILLRL
jgi:hypothetical protein